MISYERQLECVKASKEYGNCTADQNSTQRKPCSSTEDDTHFGLHLQYANSTLMHRHDSTVGAFALLSLASMSHFALLRWQLGPSVSNRQHSAQYGHKWNVRHYH